MQNITTADRTMPASLEVLQTPELLENILSFLPGCDLINASKVNELFYDCILRCPATQETMLLRPSSGPVPQCYSLLLTRAADGSWGLLVVVRALGLTPAAGMQDDDISQGALPCPAVRLCPLLRLDDTEFKGRNRAVGLSEDDRDPTSSHCYSPLGTDIARFTAELGLTDMERFPGMMITDPPQNEAAIQLWLRHSDKPAGLSVFHRVKQNSPLTLTELVKSAKLATGQVFTHLYSCPDHNKPACACGRSEWERRLGTFHGKSVETLASNYVQKFGGSFLLDLDQSYVLLNAVVPTADEWETMQDVFAAEEAKKELYDAGSYDAWIKWLLAPSASQAIWYTRIHKVVRRLL
jgi:hypothetical protein